LSGGLGTERILIADFISSWLNPLPSNLFQLARKSFLKRRHPVTGTRVPPLKKAVAEYKGQFKKKITLTHVYNEVSSEPTITRFSTIERKTLKVCL
jgi:hypothetical protein